MGGTSTDVSRYAGTYEHVFETTTAGVTIQAPQLDVNTVAAGEPMFMHVCWCACVCSCVCCCFLVHASTFFSAFCSFASQVSIVDALFGL